MARMDISRRFASGDVTPKDQTLEGHLTTRYSFSQLHMGGEVRLTFYATSAILAEQAAKSVFARYADLEQVMSDYRPSSELMQLCSKAGQGPIEVSSTLYKIVQESIDISRLTLGAFDITAAPLVRLWRETKRLGKLPNHETLLKAKSLVGWKRIDFNFRQQTVELEVPGMQLDLGGIAKGYASDEAIRVLTKQGITSAMVEAGGDISVSCSPPDSHGWVILIRQNQHPIYLSNAAISTSGDTEQFVEIDGIHYSHVVDPSTGMGVTNRVQATVIAPLGLNTDPWATALCVNPSLSHTCLHRGNQVKIFSNEN